MKKNIMIYPEQPINGIPGNENKSLLDRINAPTPAFFKTLRNAGLIIAAIGGAIISAPIALPAIVVSIAGYMTVVAGVISAVSQITVEGE